jgi:hypothetical protein
MPHVRPRRNRRFPRRGGIVPPVFKSVFLTFALPLLENFERRDPIGWVRLTKENFLAGAVQVTARQFLSPVGDNVG